MSSRDTSSSSSKSAYDIGRGRPPLETQFKPGQSGNPLGRPKGSVSLKAAYLKAASATTAVPGVSGGNGEFTLLEALMINLFRAALRGDASATRRLMELGREFPADSERGTEAEGLEIRVRWESADKATAK